MVIYCKVCRSSGTEQVTKLGKKKTLFPNKHEKDGESNEEEDLPQEQIKTQDGALITNFEVEPEEEIVYAGVVKGIRALRQQRDLLDEEKQVT